MSMIDNFVAQHCPNGVHHHEIQEIFEVEKGFTPARSNREFWKEGTIPWFQRDDVQKNGTILSESIEQISEEALIGKRLFPANSLIIATTPPVGKHALITVPHLSSQSFTSISMKTDFSDKLDIQFVYYYCFVLDNWCQAITNYNYSTVSLDKLKRFKFPVPPLSVQREIVGVLETFTKLEFELETELKMRRKQFECCRNQLLNFKETT